MQPPLAQAVLMPPLEEGAELLYEVGRVWLHNYMSSICEDSVEKASRVV